MASPALILDLIQAFRRSKTMFAAVQLGVFDLLQQTPAHAPEVARDLDLHPEACERLLDALVSLDLLTRDDRRYSCTPAAIEYLTSNSPHSMTGYIRYSNQVLYQLWGDLEGAVRENQPRWESVLQQPVSAIFENLFRTPESMRDFLMGMHGFGMLSSPAVAAAFDLSGFQHLCDLGGATGHLAMAACRRYPSVRATVFDLPRVAEFGRIQIEAAGMGDRVTVVAGDFFADPLPPADLYTLGRILHDWNEEKIQRLLAKVAAALPPQGALLISEILLDPDKTGPASAHLQSLNMLVCTEGRERTSAEYEALLREAGFATVEWRITGQPTDAILARK